MTPSRPPIGQLAPLAPLALLALLSGLCSAAQAADAAWVSYRDAYRAMVVFDKYGKPKNLIQHHLQVMPREKGASLDGVQLSLQGKATSLNLPLDAAGLATFPLLKAAYDDNASLVLNRPAAQFAFRRRVSIAVRADGVYDAAELKAACEQVAQFERQVEPGAGTRTCVGVRFVFARQGEPGVRLRKADGATAALPAIDGAAFADDPNAAFKVVNYRFGDTGQVLTTGVPVVISALMQ
ncbi:MAG: hypothetical protein ACLGI6_19765 [Gammaproteobacteria bacterium]